MKVSSYEYFSKASDPELLEIGRENRVNCAKDFFEKLVTLPVVLILKALRTISSVLGVGLFALLLMITLGTSEGVRKLFVESLVKLAKDLADWVLFPFALAGSFFRLILGMVFHPSFYFNSLV